MLSLSFRGLPKRPLVLSLTLAVAPLVVVYLYAFAGGDSFKGVAVTYDWQDLIIYFGSSSWVMGYGGLYTDVFSEYPLAANLIFAASRILSLPLTFIFSPFMAFSLVWIGLATAALFVWLGSVVSTRPRRELYLALLVPATFHFTWLRYDIYPAVACYFALLSLQRGLWNRASLWLGLCIALKGYALFFLPAYAVFLCRRLSVRQAGIAMALALLPFILSHLIVLAFSGIEGLTTVYRFHLSRDFNGESLYDSAAVLFSLFGASADTISGFRDGILTGVVPRALAIGASILAAFMAPTDIQEVADSWLFAGVGFIVASVFVSPQWVLWLLPMACFLRERKTLWLVMALGWAIWLQYPTLAGLAMLDGKKSLTASLVVVNGLKLTLLFEILVRRMLPGFSTTLATALAASSSDPSARRGR